MCIEWFVEWCNFFSCYFVVHVCALQFKGECWPQEILILESEDGLFLWRWQCSWPGDIFLVQVTLIHYFCTILSDVTFSFQVQNVSYCLRLVTEIKEIQKSIVPWVLTVVLAFISGTAPPTTEHRLSSFSICGACIIYIFHLLFSSNVCFLVPALCMFGAIPIDVYVRDVLDVYNYVGVLTDVCGYCTSCLFMGVTDDVCRCPSWCCNCTGWLGVKRQVSWLPADACRCPVWWMWVSQMILSPKWGLTGVRLVTHGTRWLSLAWTGGD